jgi:membrane-associated phospholipid phosphatase
LALSIKNPIFEGRTTIIKPKPLKSFFLPICFLYISTFCNGQADSISGQATVTKWYKTTAFKTVAAPVVLIGYGLSSIDNHGLYSSWHAQRDITAAFPGFHSHVDDYLAFSPAALAVGLKLGGIQTQHTWVDGFILYALSFALSEGLTEGLKYTVQKQRPDNSDFLSFPSGHTSFAFQGAEFLHQEYIDQSGWYSAAGYSLAAATGAMRMLNNKHWLSDVCVGAGIGILSTKLIYLVYPEIRKKILKNHPLKRL